MKDHGKVQAAKAQLDRYKAARKEEKTRDLLRQLKAAGKDTISDAIAVAQAKDNYDRTRGRGKG